MSSGAGPSHRTGLPRFPNAQVLILTSRGAPKNLRRAKLAISHRIWWKIVKENDCDEPNSLYHFRSSNSLELERLPTNALWERSDGDASGVESVAETVKPHDEHGPGVKVPGKLHGPARRNIKNISLSGDVLLIIVGNNEAQRNRWLEELRVRVAPWQVLQRRARELSLHVSVEDIGCRLEALFLRDVRAEGGIDLTVFQYPSATPDDGTDSTPRPNYFSEKLQGVDWTEKLMAQLAAVMGIIAKAVKMRADAVNTGDAPNTKNDSIGQAGIVANTINAIKDSITAEDAANTATIVGNYAKVVPGGLSTVFHLIVLGTRLAASYAEAGRGRKELPNILANVADLLHCVTESVVPVLQASLNQDKSEEILESNVFEVLVGTFDLMGKIEEQLMGNGLSQIWNAAVVKEVEDDVRDLKNQVVTVVHTKKIAQLEQKTPPVLQMLTPRPDLSPFFVGRRQEVRKLLEILREFGSAVISQYGGVGKTQLMVAFAEKAERDGIVPGGCYWIVADGGSTEICRSLSNFAERMLNVTIPEKDKVKPELAVSAVRRALMNKNERWLLCLDNVDEADDVKVSGILDSLCGFAKPTEQNGWIIVTTRRGRSKLWNRMKKDQRIVLGTFGEEDAMCVLWRIVHSKSAEECEDYYIINTIEDWSSENQEDYRSLQVLAGNHESYSLGGLALALIQAGTFIRTYECSFSEYLQEYKNAGGRDEVDELLQKSEDFAIVREQQRSVLTTWLISIERLSTLALNVLRTLSMFGNAPMPESLVKAVLEFTEDGNKSMLKYRAVIMKELVHGSSLLQCTRAEDTCIFDMHRLVRLFMVLEMKMNASVWKYTIVISFLSIQSIINSQDKEIGSLKDALELRGPQGHYHAFAPHTLSLLSHLDVHPIVDEVSFDYLLAVQEFTGIASSSIGRLNEALFAFDKLVETLRERSKEKSLDVRLASSLSMYGECLIMVAKDGEALPYLEESLSIFENVNGKNAARTGLAQTYNSLGLLYRNTGKLAEAESAWEMSMEIYSEIADVDEAEDDIMMAVVQINLGLAYFDRGRIEKAESAWKISLETLTDCLGENAPSEWIGILMNNLGMLHIVLDNHQEAQSMLYSSLNIFKYLYGENAIHSNIAVAYCNLGRLRLEQENIAEAELFTKKSLRMYKDFFGESKENLDFNNALFNMGKVYLKQGNLDEAESVLESVESFYRSQFDEDTNATYKNVLMQMVLLCDSLGEVYYLRNKFDRAVMMLEKAYKTYLKLMNEDTPDSFAALSLYQLGKAHRQQGNLLEAQLIWNRSISMLHRLGGYNNLKFILSVLLDFADLFEDKGKILQAESVLRRALTFSVEIYGKDAAHEDVAKILGKTGAICFMLGKEDEAESMINRSLQMFNKLLSSSEESISALMIQSNLAILYLNQGKHVKAESIAKKVYVALLQNYGKDTAHLNLAKVLNNLGLIYRVQGKTEEASLMFQQSRDMYCTTSGENSARPVLAQILTNLSAFYLEQGKNDEAEPLCKEAIEIFKNMFGKDCVHPSFASANLAMGLLYHGKGNIDKAIEFWNSALDMYHAVFGKDAVRQEIAVTLNNLGSACLEQHDIDGAESLCQEAIEMQIKLFGENAIHINIAMTLNNLGMLYLVQDKDIEAELMLTRSVEINKNIYGESTACPASAKNYLNLGKMYYFQDKPAKAVSHLQISLGMFQSVFGSEAPNIEIAVCYYFLGRSNKSLNKLEEAKKSISKSLDILTRASPSSAQNAILGLALIESAEISSEEKEIEGVYFDDGTLNEADECFRKALETYRSIHGESAQCLDIADTLSRLGEVYLKQKKYDAAVATFCECVETYRNLEDVDQVLLAAIIYDLGCSYRGKGDFAKAEANYRECLDIYIACYGVETNDEDVVGAFASLGEVLEAQNKLTEAKEMFEKSIQHYRREEDEEENAEVTKARSCLSRITETLATKE